eukprot:XP_019919494.1 PREDICTED: uncharacterized protein LOC109617585 [Crassostrea gigas]
MTANQYCANTPSMDVFWPCQDQERANYWLTKQSAAQSPQPNHIQDQDMREIDAPATIISSMDQMNETNEEWRDLQHMDKEQEGTNVYDHLHLDPRFFFLGAPSSYRKEHCAEELIKQTVATELQSQSSLAFTTDTWKSCATEGYLTLTAHFIDSMWQLRYYALATIEVKDHHTGENLANEIKCIVEDFGISNTPVSGNTTDNAANMGEDSIVLVSFKEAVTKDLSSRFPKSDHDLATHHAVLTCALDPRYKSLKFMTDEQRNLVKSNIEKFDTQTEHVPVEPPVVVKSENTDNAESNKAEVNAMSFLLGDLVDLTGEEVDAEKSLVQEYEMFVRETAVKGNADPLDWWKNKADSYKKLAPIAKFFLCIPGTFVPSERVFSDTGNIVTKKRASLDPDTVNQLVFLRSVLSSTKTKVDSAEESVLPDDKNSASTSALEVKQERASEPPSLSKKESLPLLPLLEPDNDEDD